MLWAPPLPWPALALATGALVPARPDARENIEGLLATWLDMVKVLIIQLLYQVPLYFAVYSWLLSWRWVLNFPPPCKNCLSLKRQPLVLYQPTLPSRALLSCADTLPAPRWLFPYFMGSTRKGVGVVCNEFVPVWDTPAGVSGCAGVCPVRKLHQKTHRKTHRKTTPENYTGKHNQRRFSAQEKRRCPSSSQIPLPLPLCVVFFLVLAPRPTC